MQSCGGSVSIWDLVGELLGPARAHEIRYESVTTKWKARQARREGPG